MIRSAVRWPPAPRERARPDRGPHRRAAGQRTAWWRAARADGVRGARAGQPLDPGQSLRPSGWSASSTRDDQEPRFLDAVSRRACCASARRLHRQSRGAGLALHDAGLRHQPQAPGRDHGRRAPAATAPLAPIWWTRPGTPATIAVIREFERRTGIGAVLNTSFNLHGEPLVSSPADALDTFERSGLPAPGAGSVPDLREVARPPGRRHRRRAMLSEFKTFIMRGNVMDLAVGIVIGAAFTTVVNLLRHRPADAAHGPPARQGGFRQSVRQPQRSAVCSVAAARRPARPPSTTGCSSTPSSTS